jgi:Ca2+-binding RTX toxin-like protein
VMASVHDVTLSGTTGGLTVADVQGMLSVTSGVIAANEGDTHNLGWTFNSGSQTFNFLGTDQSLTITYTVRVNDGNSGIDDQSVTIKIAGPTDPYNNDDLANGTAVVVNGSNVFGTTGNDTIAGGNSGQTVYGGVGDDTIIAGTGSDTIYGGSGNDTIFGNNGTDTIYGGSGNDTINGATASDLIIGGYGADQLTGENGNDTFKFLSTLDSPASPGSYDTITDFDSGNDDLDFSEIAGINTIQGATTGTVLNPNSIAWVVNSADNSIDVYVNTTGSAQTIGGTGAEAPNMQIHLANTTSLSALNDFVI